MKIFEGDLVLTENTIFKEDIKVNGNIRCKGGLWDINAWNIYAGDINAWNIYAEKINAKNIDARNIDALSIDALNIDALNINAFNIDAKNINFFAFAIASCSFKCKSWKGRRENHIAKCLDGEIEIIKPKFCDKCGQPLKE